MIALPPWISPHAARALAVVGLGALVFAAGALFGHRSASQAADLREAQATAAAERAKQQALADARADGDALVAQLRQQLAAGYAYANTVERRLSHVQLVVPSRRCPPTARPGVEAAPPTQAALVGAAAEADGDGRLTLGAVSLWNSALAGGDVAAGACRADATAEPACAADAGLDIRAAWANHATNASLCAADRARFNRLIDYLQRRQSAMKQGD